MVCFFIPLLTTAPFMNFLIYEPSDKGLTIDSNQIIKLESHICEICKYVGIDFNDYTQHLVLAHGKIMEKTKMITLHAVVNTGVLSNREHSTPANKQPIEDTLPIRINLPSYTCKICGHFEPDFYLYCEHLKSTHADVLRNVPKIPLQPIKTDPSQVICTICNRALIDIDGLHNHVRRHLPKSVTHKYICKECGKRYYTIGEFNNHLKGSHSEERPFSCDLCVKTFKLERFLNVHMKSHSKAYKCEVCGKEFTSERYLNLHKFKCIPDKEGVKCNICAKSFLDLARLKMHNLQVHNNNCKCKMCHEEFKSHYVLSQHMQNVHQIGFKEKKLHMCTICNKSYPLATSLRKHIRTVHMDVGKQVCDVCGKEVASSNSLRDHKLIHDGIKEFQCNECGKTFTTKNYLKVHINSHIGEKRHSCSICDKKFTQRSTLVIHMRYHNGERPYKCDVCQEFFITKTIMNMHKKKKHKIAD